MSIKTELNKFRPPFRVGKKQNRAVLDSKGIEVVVFPISLEYFAADYCRYLNAKYERYSELESMKHYSKLLDLLISAYE